MSLNFDNLKGVIAVRSSRVSIVVVALLALQLLVSLIATPARAASSWDNIPLGDTVVACGDSCNVPSTDVKSDFVTFLYEISADHGGYYDEYIDSIATAQTFAYYQELYSFGYEASAVCLAYSRNVDEPLSFITEEPFSVIRPINDGNDWDTFCLYKDYSSLRSDMLKLSFTFGFNGDFAVVGTTTDTVRVAPILYSGELEYPVGYEGAQIPQTWSSPEPRYVAMGDSFSSGEGNPPFEQGTDASSNKCHRSGQAYPRLLANDSSLDFGSADFVACSGATTSSLRYGGTGVGAWSEPPQIAVLTPSTEVVTITIGGNDVGFGDYAYSCVKLGCGAEDAAFDDMVDRILDPVFESNLKQAFNDILFMAPNADVYVLNYPYMTAEGEAWCNGFNVATARPVQELLNHVIWGAVRDVGLASSRIHLVDTNRSDSPFEGKYLCNGGEEYFHGIILNPSEQIHSLHPNTAGQQAYYQVIKAALSEQ